MEPNTEQIKMVPTTVKIIALFYLITAIFSALGAIIFFIYGAAYGAFSPFAQFGTVGIVAVLIFAFIAFAISKGLRRGKNWARRIAIIASIVTIVATFYQPRTTIGTGTIFQILVNLLIIGYLLFNKQARTAFRQ